MVACAWPICLCVDSRLCVPMCVCVDSRLCVCGACMCWPDRGTLPCVYVSICVCVTRAGGVEDARDAAGAGRSHYGKSSGQARRTQVGRQPRTSGPPFLAHSHDSLMHTHTHTHMCHAPDVLRSLSEFLTLCVYVCVGDCSWRARRTRRRRRHRPCSSRSAARWAACLTRTRRRLCRTTAPS
jgi:hypothetical protein